MSVVGIDLGTTNTVVACVRGGKVHVLADEAGSRLLPSVVSFHPNGEVLVGPAAKTRRVIDPKHTIANHKRIIGHSWNSPELVEARQRAPFELREGPGQGALVHVRGQDYTLPEISAFVLKRARQIAETALGEPVERAVITVPAHFNELQRASTKVAGRISGVDVMRILNEPTAAALAYGLGRGGAERVAIYDFGGGTFDCTLLDLNGNVFEVLASAGDSFLGGDDVDAAIAERMADYILKQYRYDARTDKQAFERLKVAGEAVKMTLSTKEEATTKLDDVGFGVGGAPLNVTFTLKRKELEQLILPLIERSFKVTQDALALARLSPSAFDRVILVGGSTRIPLVRARVEAFFGGKPMDKLNPDEVVAVGAAIQAAALVDAGRRREIPAPPPLPGTSPKTMRGTGPGGKDFDDSDSTESNTLAKGDGPPVTASGIATQPNQQKKSGTWPPGQRPVPGRSSPPGKISQPPGKISQPPGKISQPPGRGSQPPGRGSQPPASARGPQTQAPGTKPMPTLQKPAPIGGTQSSDEASFPDLAVPSPFEWGQNASTLTAQVDTEALKGKPLSRTGESTLTASANAAPASRDFGAMDEPPSLHSTTGALTAFEGFGGEADEPMPEGPFGEVRDISLVSTTGLTQTAAIPQPPPPRGPALPREEPGQAFGHVADDLSLVSSSSERSSPSIPSIPSIQERTSPLPMGMNDPTGVPLSGPKPARSSGAIVGGRTVQMQGAPPPAQAAEPFQLPTRQGASPKPEAPSPPPLESKQKTQQGVGRSTVAMNQSSQAGPSQPPPPNAHSSAPPAYPSNAPSMGGGGFSGFGSQPPGVSPSTAPGPVQPQAAQNPVFSGYGQQGAPPLPPPAGQPGLPGQPGYGGTYPPGGSPFGGTTEPPFQGSPLQEASRQLGMQAPVLVDVTPRALIVETAGGYVDTIIPRNSKIPCERMRKFSTSRDGQTVVRIRVGQGENPRFPENTYLGEVELAGLRQASRGDVTVAVSFELDADGTLRVRAWDTITLQEARATLQLIGMADESSVVMMINRFAQQPMGPPQ